MLGHANAQQHRELDEVMGTGPPCRVDRDVSARVSVGQGVVVREVEEADGGGYERQAIRVELVGLARELDTADRAQSWERGFRRLAGPAEHGHVEPGVVRHEHVVADEIEQTRELRHPAGRVLHLVGGDPVDRDVDVEEAVVSRGRADEPSVRGDDFAVADSHESDRAGGCAGGVRRLEVDRGEVQCHVPSVTRHRQPAAEARRRFVRSGRSEATAAGHVDWMPVALTIGIVGLPNVGKSTLFNALTKNQVLAANYPFATIEPNVGVVNLPDPRLKVLADIFHSERILPAAVSFVDIAGIVRGASEGEGLGNQFLANIREADAIAQVVRGFADDDVVHVEGAVNPQNDMETINAELQLADLQTLEKAITRYEKEVRGKKLDPSVLESAKAAQDALQRGELLSGSGSAVDIAPIRELGLLTAKPFIFVFNVDEAVLTDDARKAELAALVAPAQAVFLDAKIESELIDLDPEEAAELLASTGQDESGLDQLARIGFDTLGLQTYLTAGPKEARAWTIGKGWKAPQAAGVIHTDFEKGFIKAEVISFDDLVATGSVAEARSKGKARLEGKDYVMQDGDVVEFRFNV